MSPIVGVILMLAIEMTCALVILEVDQWTKPTEPTYEEVAASCHCEPPTGADGQVCQDVSLPYQKAHVAWLCHGAKQELGGY